MFPLMWLHQLWNKQSISSHLKRQDVHVNSNVLGDVSWYANGESLIQDFYNVTEIASAFKTVALKVFNIYPSTLFSTKCLIIC